MTKSWWIINISKLNVSLSDLGLTVPAGRSFNLLDAKHFSYTEEQLENSTASGSLFKKSDKIKRRPPPPKIKPATLLEEAKDFRPGRRRTVIQVEEFNYDELPSLNDDQNVSDQKFAEEFAHDSEFK